MVTRLLCLVIGVLVPVAAFAQAPAPVTPASPGSGPVYEVRTYTISAGRYDEELQRFRAEWMRIFPKHGLHGILYLVPMEPPLAGVKFVYILEHPSREAADRSWNEFAADPEVQEISKRYNANGRLVTNVDRFFAKAADFSPVPPETASLVVAACDSAVAAQQPDIAAICRVNARWDETNLRMDASIGEPILDDQFFWIDGAQLRPKADIVNIWRTTPVRFERYDSDGVVVYLTPSMAEAVGTSHRKTRNVPPNAPEDWRFTRTFVKRDGTWRILSHTYTKLETK